MCRLGTAKKKGKRKKNSKRENGEPGRKEEERRYPVEYHYTKPVDSPQETNALSLALVAIHLALHFFLHVGRFSPAPPPPLLLCLTNTLTLGFRI